MSSNTNVEMLTRQRSLDLSMGAEVVDDSIELNDLRILQSLKEHRCDLSNRFNVWDSAPKYCISGYRQRELRKHGPLLDSVEIGFPPGKPENKLTMHPARILDEKTKIWTDYFPTVRDERVEKVLIRFLLDKDKGNYETIAEEQATMVVFTIRDIRKYIPEAGHKDVARSLEVLAKTSLEIKLKGRDPFITSVINELQMPVEKGGYYVAKFSTMITQAIYDRQYDQYPLDLYLELSDLAGWIFIEMIKTRNLDVKRPVVLTTSAALIAGRCTPIREYDRIASFRKAGQELRKKGYIRLGDGETLDERRLKSKNKIIDCEFHLFPTNKLVSFVVANHSRNAYLNNKKIFLDAKTT